jgi:hypothetical protein
MSEKKQYLCGGIGIMAKKNEIAKKESAAIQPLENIEHLIHVIRGKQVMLDRDLARLYGVETKALNQAVKRNMERFPEDFMFQLSKDEFEDLKSQIAISSDDEILRSQNVTSSEDEILRSQNVTSSWGGQRYMPYVFSENGVAMLSTILRSQQAISINIQIMRAFNAMRHFIASNAQAFQRLEIIERNQLALNVHLSENDKKLEEVFRRLDEGGTKPTEGILFDGQIFDAYKFVTERIREAKKRIVLIDNYIDETVLAMLDKRNKGVVAKVYTKNISRQLSLDFDKHNAQYAPIEVEQFDRAHDRFLCIDDTVYLIGASIKDLGKKWFGFTKMDSWTTDELLSKI